MLTLNVHVSLFTTLAISKGVAVSFHTCIYTNLSKGRSWSWSYGTVVGFKTTCAISAYHQ